MITSSLGALEIEKPRVLPSASVSGGSSRVMSMNWPARKVQPAGFAKRNAIVRSATSSRLEQGCLEDGPGDGGGHALPSDTSQAASAGTRTSASRMFRSGGRWAPRTRSVTWRRT